MAHFHVMAGAEGTLEHPVVRRIDTGDLIESLRLGFNDFWDKPSHYVFLCLIYPVIGMVLIEWASGDNLLPLIFPLVSGFALLGPFAAIGLYEISRRRELGIDSSWTHVFEVLKSPAIPAIALVGLMLVALFVTWILTARGLYHGIFGHDIPASIPTFVNEILTTGAGWTLILVGNAIGFVFALVVLSTTVIAFPLLLDRDVGAVVAVQTSIRAVMANPVVMMLWGLIVAVALIAGGLTLFVGLAVVLPVLGHATWHLYRKVVEAPR